MSFTKNINGHQIQELFNSFIEYYNKIKVLSNHHKLKIRLPNFQEDLSENIIRLYINNYEKRNCECSKIGDLCVDNLKIEVKCFSSTGPTSFGPTESWDEIYFLDATEFYNNKFKIYKCNLANDSKKWQNIKINKNDTYLDMCKLGKRPRIVFSSLKLQLKRDIKEIYNGNLENIINNDSMEV